MEFFRYSSWEVHAGALNFRDESEPGRVIVTSSDATFHEKYNELSLNNDIAVIKLSEQISGPSKIHFIDTTNFRSGLETIFNVS
jgi:secreted trypsin-like serine protease